MVLSDTLPIPVSVIANGQAVYTPSIKSTLPHPLALILQSLSLVPHPSSSALIPRPYPPAHPTLTLVTQRKDRRAQSYRSTLIEIA